MSGKCVGGSFMSLDTLQYRANLVRGAEQRNAYKKKMSIIQHAKHKTKELKYKQLHEETYFPSQEQIYYTYLKSKRSRIK